MRRFEVARWALLLMLVAAAGARAQTTVWTQCAVEGGTCTVPTQKLVRYGEPFNNRWTAPRSVSGSIACTNAAFGTDPSPSVGKRCEYTDLPPSLPPITNPVSYVVDWTPPTKNTDGSAIKPILKTFVQASTTADYLPGTVYSYEAVGSASSLTVEQGPSGTIYWRAFVETADGMSAATTPSVVTYKQYLDARAPICEPLRPGGDATLATQARYDLALAGGAMYYACKRPDGTWQDAGVWGVYKWGCIAETAAAYNVMDTEVRRAELRRIWSSCVDVAATVADSPYKPLWDALRAQYRPAAPLPPATHVVKPYGTLKSRPAFRILNGVRTETVVGRVEVLPTPASCDCTAFKSGEYCAVTGRENVATAAIDQLPASAALCAPKP